MITETRVLDPEVSCNMSRYGGNLAGFWATLFVDLELRNFNWARSSVHWSLSLCYLVLPYDVCICHLS